MGQTEEVIFADNNERFAVLGERDKFLEEFGKSFDCRIQSRGNSVKFLERDAVSAAEVMRELVRRYRKGGDITVHEVRYAIKTALEGEPIANLYGETVLVTAKGRHISPKTLGQKNYIEAMKTHEIVFGVGPAGTGKTYLAVVMAAAALRKKSVSRIILTRPAVEAGEHLGFLPGDLQEKVDPYLRPLYDALQDILGLDLYQKFLNRNIIEIAPLAYMRGRTLNDAFIILDEAQNTTEKQMKMFLTRLGFSSRMVVTGDLSQTDLPRGSVSGLKVAAEILKDVKGVAVEEFTMDDVVRSPLVSRIVAAYERYETQNFAEGGERNGSNHR